MCNNFVDVASSNNPAPRALARVELILGVHRREAQSESVLAQERRIDRGPITLESLKIRVGVP